MPTPGEPSARQRFLDEPKQQALDTSAVIATKKRDKPIEKQPGLLALGRVPRKRWLASGPKDASPPAVKYVFKNNGRDETWETVAAGIGKSAQWLIQYNFRLPLPIDKAVVNWFLREYVGATVPTFDRKNWTFENTTIGYIWVPQDRPTRIASVDQAHDRIVQQMHEIELLFPGTGGKLNESRFDDIPYLVALKGYADTMNALLNQGDYTKRCGDYMEKPPEFPVPAGAVDVWRYRGKGYGVGYDAAIKFWDEQIPKPVQKELQLLKPRDCIDRLYAFARSETERVMESTSRLLPGYPPCPKD